MLTATAVHQHERQRTAAHIDRETRVKVFTPNGEQIGIEGVGEGNNLLTFPRKSLVGDALGQTWLRFSTEKERQEEEGTPAAMHLWPAQTSSWWRISEFQPQSLIHCGKDGEGFVATPEQEMGLIGDRMHAVAHASPVHFTEKPCDDVDDTPTPPTPSSPSFSC